MIEHPIPELKDVERVLHERDQISDEITFCLRVIKKKIEQLLSIEARISAEDIENAQKVVNTINHFLGILSQRCESIYIDLTCSDSFLSWISALERIEWGKIEKGNYPMAIFPDEVPKWITEPNQEIIN